MKGIMDMANEGIQGAGNKLKISADEATAGQAGNFGLAKICW